MQLINYDSGRLKCSVSGEIDHHSAKRIREEVDRRIKEYTPTEVVMDLSGVTFMDSSGLGLVLGRSNPSRATSKTTPRHPTNAHNSTHDKSPPPADTTQ